MFQSWTQWRWIDVISWHDHSYNDFIFIAISHFSYLSFTPILSFYPLYNIYPFLAISVSFYARSSSLLLLPLSSPLLPPLLLFDLFQLIIFLIVILLVLFLSFSLLLFLFSLFLSFSVLFFFIFFIILFLFLFFLSTLWSVGVSWEIQQEDVWVTWHGTRTKVWNPSHIAHFITLRSTHLLYLSLSLYLYFSLSFTLLLAFSLSRLCVCVSLSLSLIHSLFLNNPFATLRSIS